LLQGYILFVWSAIQTEPTDFQQLILTALVFACKQRLF